MISLCTLVISLWSINNTPNIRTVTRLVSYFLNLVDAIRAPNLQSLRVDFRHLGESAITAATEGGHIDWAGIRRGLRAIRGPHPGGPLRWVTVPLDVDRQNADSAQVIQSGLRELEDEGMIEYSFEPITEGPFSSSSPSWSQRIEYVSSQNY